MPCAWAGNDGYSIEKLFLKDSSFVEHNDIFIISLSTGNSKKISAFFFRVIVCINLLKPTGYVMHHQFNIQQLYALPTLYLCVLYLSENKQRLVPLTA